MVCVPMHLQLEKRTVVLTVISKARTQHVFKEDLFANAKKCQGPCSSNMFWWPCFDCNQRSRSASSDFSISDTLDVPESLSVRPYDVSEASDISWALPQASKN